MSRSHLVGFIIPSLSLQEKGNEYVKLGKKHYSDAIDCYTRAINQKVLSDSENSVLFSNRAHVNLLLGNYRRALTDAKEAIKLCPTNIKVCTFILVLLAYCCLICTRRSSMFTCILFQLFCYKPLTFWSGTVQSCQSIIISESLVRSETIL